MLNTPRKTKKNKLVKLEYKATILKFGVIGLGATKASILNSRQMESTKRFITRKTKRKAKIWIRIFPDISITSKPTGVWIRKGGNQATHWECLSTKWNRII